MEPSNHKLMAEKVERLYDASAIALNEIAADLIETEGKFGTTSKVVTRKRQQLAAMRALYDGTLEHINYLRQNNFDMYIAFKMQEFKRFKAETGLPYEQMAKLIGWDNTAQWKNVDKIDELINKVVELNKSQHLQQSDFDAFIVSIRK